MIDQLTKNKEIGQLIRQYREEVGLKQNELAQKIGTDPSMLSRFESGRFSPTQQNLQKIISKLQLAGLSEEKVNNLWEAAGYYQTRIFDTPVSSKVIPTIHQELEDLQENNPDGKAWLEEELQGALNINHDYWIANKHMNQRKWLLARQELMKLSDFVDHRVQKLYLRLDQDLGACHFSVGHYDEAIRAYESAFWRAHQIEDEHALAEVLVRLGSIHRRRGGEDWKIARERYEKALNIYRKIGDLDMEVNCLRKIGGTYLFQGLPNDALPFIEDSLTMSQQRGYTIGIYKGLQHRGWAYDLLGSWSEATLNHQHALEMIKEAILDEWELAKAYWYVADAYRLERRREEARLAYETALQVFQKYEEEGSGAKLILGMILLGLGKVCIRQPGQEFRAKIYLNDSMKIYKELGEDFKIAEILNEQGDLLLKLGRYDEAEMRLEQACKQLERLGNNFHYAKSLVSLGELYYQRRRFHEIPALMQKTKNLDKQELLNYHLSRLELLLGKALVMEKQFREAFEAFQRASSHALGFNEQTFTEIRSEIISFSNELPFPIISRFLSQYDNYLQLMNEREPQKRELLKESQKIIKDKQRELDMLLPIS